MLLTPDVSIYSGAANQKDGRRAKAWVSTGLAVMGKMPEPNKYYSIW